VGAAIQANDFQCLFPMEDDVSEIYFRPAD